MNGNNFTQDVRDVITMAREEAVRLGHEYIGSEHLLLGLLRDQSAVGSGMLQQLSVDVEAVRDKVDRTVKRGTGISTASELPYTSRGKKVLELAVAAAQEFGHQRVGTEHLLLAMIREQKGIAAVVLTEAAVTEDAVRNALLSLRAQGSLTRESDGTPERPPAKRINIEIQLANGTVVRRESASTRDAILFLLRS